jgi:hypothetical protein
MKKGRKMSIFEELSNNKGTVSSALGKELAKKVLQDGQTGLLTECIDLVTYEVSEVAAKNIRAGAAKVVEIVAEKRPELVADHFEALLPALSAPELQTRWMIIRAMGFCAHLNKPIARKAIEDAKRYLEEKEGLIIASSADLFLGDFGALSKEDAQFVFPILAHSMDTLVKNEQDWLLVALYKMYPNLGEREQNIVLEFAEDWQHSARKSTQKRARRILKLR